MVKGYLPRFRQDEDGQFEKAVVINDFLELTGQLKSVLLQSNPQNVDGLKTAGEMLADWIDLVNAVPELRNWYRKFQKVSF